MMNAKVIQEQVQNFLWLRWRIQSNQLRKSSAIGKVVAALMLVGFCMGILMALVSGVLAGVLIPRIMDREYYFLLWDGFVAFTCALWLFYLIADLQRSDAITFDRLLHLPVSFEQVFAINYFCSLLGLHTLCLSSLGLGFILGSVFSLGLIAFLFLIPFVAFLAAITALTYQFQGWIATLMSNPKRRRAILIALPFTVVALIQIPAFVLNRLSDRDSKKANVAAPETPPTEGIVDEAKETPVPETPVPETAAGEAVEAEKEASKVDLKTDAKDDKKDNAIEGGQEEAGQKEAESRNQEEAKAAKKAQFDQLIARVRWANLVLPPFWLAGSVDSIITGKLHFLWMTPVMVIVACWSLRTNYYATLRFYKGDTDTRSAKRAANKAATDSNPIVDAAAGKAIRKSQWIDRSLPGVHEETNAVIGMTWQSMVRAPEVKLFLLLPLITPFLLFGVLQVWKMPPIDELKAGMVVVASAVSMLMAAGLISNQFGFDRSGFRAFVLSPIRRERILLARNLAVAPFLLVQSVLLAIAMSFYFGFAFDKLLCAILLTAAMLPAYCLLMNLMSILTPFPLAAGSIQPQQFNFIPMITNLGLSMFLPVIVGVTLIPLGVEWLIDHWVSATIGVPFALLLSIPWVGISIWLYALAIPWQGKLLAKREQAILLVVTSKSE